MINIPREAQAHSRIRRILHIQKVSGIAGSENHLLMLLPAIDRGKFDVMFIALEPSPGGAGAFLRRLDQHGVPAHRVRIRSVIDPICIIELAQIMKHQHFDLVHTHLIHADVHGIVAAKLASVPRIVSSKHGYSLPGPKRLLYRANGPFMRCVDGVIAVSDSLADHKAEVERIPRNRIVTIPYATNEIPGTQATIRDRIRSQLGFDQSEKVLLSVGRLVAVKGHIYLLQALARLAVRGLRPRVIIAGDGPLRSHLERTADKLGLLGQVLFLGYRTDVRHLLQACDAFVFPSLGEGFGLAALEAMAAAKPVVAFKVTGMTELVVDRVTGILVAPEDIDGLALALEEILRNEETARALGIQGMERAQTEYSLEKMVKSTQNVYDRLLA